jgi:hypothetical protein
LLSYFFCSHKLHPKIVNYFIFDGKEKNLSHLTIIVLFTQQIVIKHFKIRVGDPRSGIHVRDPRSGIRDLEKPIPDPGVKKAPDPQHGGVGRSADPVQF